MKYLLSLLVVLLLACSSSKGQYYVLQTSPQEDSVYISNYLQPFVTEFILEAQSRGLDPTSRIVQLDSIVLNADNRYLGLAANNNVYINVFLTIDTHISKVVLFHELFHAVYDLRHCHNECYHLMGATKPDTFTFSYYYDYDAWQKVLDIEFNKIKNDTE